MPPPGYTEVLQENHYYPFGMNMDGPWRVPQGADGENFYQYNGKAAPPMGSGNMPMPGVGLGMELVTDIGLNVNTARYRTYDFAIGRFWQVDPESEGFYGWNPYNSNLNNPIRYNDPNGDCPNCIIGAIVGAALDYGLQVAGNYIGGKTGLDAWKDVDGASIIASAASGALGVGVVGKIKQSANLTMKGKVALEMAVDGGLNVGQQVVKGEGVDLTETAVAAVSGNVLRSKAQGAIKDAAAPKAKKLAAEVKQAERYATNAAKKSSRAGKIQAKKNTAAAKQKQMNHHQATTRAAAAASGVVAAGAVPKSVNTYKKYRDASIPYRDTRKRRY